MVRRIIKVVEEKCEGCGTCITVCSKGALTLSNGKAKLVKEKICDSNGICVSVCPNYALTYEEREVDDYDNSSIINEKLRTMLSGTPSPFPPYIFSGNSGYCPCINATRSKNNTVPFENDSSEDNTVCMDA